MFISSSSAWAEAWIEVSRSGNGHVTWQSQVDGKFHHTFEPRGDVFRGSSTQNLPVRSGFNGATSANTVAATVEQQFSKKQVTNAILQKARIAGKALGKGAARLGSAAIGNHPLGRAFWLATLALEGSKYFWDDEKGNFVKPKDGNTYIVFTVMDGSSLSSYDSTNESDFQKMCEKRSGGCEVLGFVKGSESAQEMATKYCQSVKYGSGKTFDYVGWAGYCASSGVIAGDWSRAVKIYIYNDYIPISEDEFFDEAESAADKKPGEWVETSGIQPDGEPSVKVPAGTVAQSDPYTDPRDGKVKQTRWDFDKDGKAKETIIERPDLTPDSPEAPKLDPLPEEETPKSDKDGDSEKDKDKEKTETEDLCEKNPDIMACDKQPEIPDEQNFEIPQENVDVFFTPDTIFPTSGTCPAPVSFNVNIPFAGSKTFSFDTMPICEIAKRLRNLLIAIAWLATAVFCFRSFSLTKE